MPTRWGKAPGGVHLPVVDGQEPKARFFAAHQEVQGGGQHGAAAVAKAVDGADNRLGAGEHVPGVFGPRRLPGLPVSRSEFAVFVDVSAGGKSPFAGSGNDDGAHAVVCFIGGDRLVHFTHQLEVQRVEHFRPVHGDDADVGFNLAAAHLRGTGHGFGIDARVGGNHYLFLNASVLDSAGGLTPLNFGGFAQSL